MAKTTKSASTLRRNSKRVLAALQAAGVGPRARALVSQSPPLRVLGLDLNTNSTGYAVLCERGRVCEWGHVPTNHLASADVLRIARAVDDAMGGVLARVDAEKKATWRVGVEDFMRTYRFGRFHTRGIFQLAQLNGTVSYACWRRLGDAESAQPVHTHPSAARGFFGIAATKAGKKATGESDIKEQVMAFVEREWRKQQEQEAEEEGCSQQARLFLSRPGSDGACDVPADSSSRLFARTRGGNLSDAALDVADAYVIAAFTRWRHFHDQLLLDADLAAQFADAYVALTAAHADARKSATPAAEERALAAMGAAARATHLRGLFAHGVDAWVRRAQAAPSGTWEDVV
ncbi:hypothetical protein PybrP1_009387 [[Pythium] brassicae (nom. inval.)]|nr:hypothetical protein PybrP1_009387 [[Pythium] brassicae (nom. inval.)]